MMMDVTKSPEISMKSARLSLDYQSCYRPRLLCIVNLCMLYCKIPVHKILLIKVHILFLFHCLKVEYTYMGLHT